MRRSSFFTPGRSLTAALAVALLWTAGPAFAQDLRVQFRDSAGQAIEAGVWTPDGPAAAPRPLVVISHGSLGGLSGHQDTAQALAEAGFVVAALTHPGDNYLDPSRSLQLTDRPPHVSALIEYMTGEWSGSEGIDATRIGAFGFSAGGFTVLTLAGGEADAGAILEHCAAHPEFFVCTLTSPEALDVAGWAPRGADPRVRAVVAAAPGFGFSFSDESLGSVRIPVQLWQAGEDQILPAPFHVETVRDRLPDGVEYHMVPGARHHDFMTPCTAQMSAALPQLCESNAGFDRAVFKAEFNREVVRFFQRELSAP